VIIELKWGQGAKDIGGEIQVSDIEQARFLKKRGYVVDPDPDDPAVIKAFEGGAIRSFARHSRLGATDVTTPEELREDFLAGVERLRAMGFRRISLKTGAYGMEALALALRVAADAKLDLLTIDGAGGGTGMSPWNMMDHWGVPSLQLHSKTYEYCKVLEGNGISPPDISLAGGFAREDHIFKAMALCAPYAKLVCMGRAPMIPGYVGTNIESLLRPEQTHLPKHWEQMPTVIKNLGSAPEEIFAGWEAVKEKVGEDAMDDIPFGAIAMFGYADKLAAGLQQLLAGARKFTLAEIERDDLMAANWETANLTHIPLTTEAQNEKALELLKG
jgi:glutamate synthase domain-containing protein 2